MTREQANKARARLQSAIDLSLDAVSELCYSAVRVEYSATELAHSELQLATACGHIREALTLVREGEDART